jgi:hypothetical protein
MDIDLIKTVSTITFFVVIGFFAIISMLAAFVFIRYGRTKSITVLMSLGFGGLFILGVLSAYLTLQNIF